MHPLSTVAGERAIQGNHVVGLPHAPEGDALVPAHILLGVCGFREDVRRPDHQIGAKDPLTGPDLRVAHDPEMKRMTGA